MQTSQTWQYLPHWLQWPVFLGVLSLAEAAELWDHTLLSTQEWEPLPPHLFSAAERLFLLEAPTRPTKH